MGHGVVFISDLFASSSRANGDKELLQNTKVGDNVLIGSNATILPVTICDNAAIGAGSVVITHIIKPGIYAGNPARLLRLIK